MTKLKTLLGICVGIFLIALLLFIAIVTLVDPSQFKERIQNELSARTSITVKLEGPLFWQLDPNFSVVASNVVIQNLKKNSMLESITLQKVRLEPKFLPLLKGKLWLNTELSEVNFKLNALAANLPQLLNELEIKKLNTNWHYDPKTQQLLIKNFNGIFNLPNFPQTTLTGNFSLNKLNADPKLQGTFQFSLAQMGKAILELSIQADQHFATISSLNGTLQSDRLQWGPLMFTQLKTPVAFQDGIWTFEPLQVQMANTSHQGKLQIDVQNSLPKFYFTDHLECPEIQEVLHTFFNEDFIKGKMSAKMSLLAQGTTLEESLRSLTGSAQLTLTDGKIMGIELLPLLQHIQSTTATFIDGLSKGQPVNMAALVAAELGEWKSQAENSKKFFTPFRSLEADFEIQNKMLLSKNFKLLHPGYTVEGHGTLDLAHQQAEYQVHAWLNQPVKQSSLLVEKYLKETPLSLQIHGPLNNLTIYPDLNQYTHEAAKLVEKDPRILPEKGGNPLEKLFGFP